MVLSASFTTTISFTKSEYKDKRLPQARKMASYRDGPSKSHGLHRDLARQLGLTPRLCLLLLQMLSYPFPSKHAPIDIPHTIPRAYSPELCCLREED